MNKPPEPASPAAARPARAWPARLLRLRPYEVELLQRRTVVPPLGWILFGAGLLLAALALWRLQPLLAQRARLAQERTALELALARAGVPARRTAPATDHGAADGQAVLEELHRPWHDLFDQLESAALADGGQLHVVQLAIDPRFSTVQVVAEARDLGRIIHFARRLSGGAPIRALALTHYEWRDALGGHVVSASLQGELVLPRSVPGLSLAAVEPTR